MTELLVTYPAGSTAESSTVTAVTRRNSEVLFAVERTPCHPESPRWPDQPQDRCTLEVDGVQIPVQCYEGYLLDGELHLARIPEGTDLPEAPHPAETHTAESHTAESHHLPGLDCSEGPHPAEGPGLPERPGLPEGPDPTEGSDLPPKQAIPCVVHSASAEAAMAVGDKVSLRVDERYRRAVSHSHSRCHLVSLALNAALADKWRRDKDPPARDSLGSPDFDKLAIVSSRIDEAGSLDVYRVGRHVRKAGFPMEALNNTKALAGQVAEIAKAWLKSSPEVSVTPGECRLEERRTWSCALPEGTASFSCGGTHPSRMEPDEGLAVAIAWDPQARHLQMRAKGSLFHV